MRAEIIRKKMQKTVLKRGPDQCAYMRQTKVEPVQKLSEVFWVT